MFGFKSKKDKRIEELEHLLYVSQIQQPKIFQQNYNVETVSAMTVIEPGMPVDYAKGIIAGKIFDELKDRGLYFEVVSDNYRTAAEGITLRGTLHYVPNEMFPRK